MLLQRLLLVTLLTASLFACDDGNFPSQNPEVDELLALAENIQFTQSDTALIITRQALDQSEKANYSNGIGAASELMGSLLYQMGGLSQAIEHLNKALSTYEDLELPVEEAQTNLLLAKVYQRSGNANQAFLYLHRAQYLFTQLNDDQGKAQVFGSLGHYYEKSEQYDSALHYQLLALDILSKAGKNTTADIHDNIGSIYEDLNQFEKAKKHFETAFAINQENNIQSAAIVNINNIGDSFRKLGNLDSALSYSLKALHLAEAANLDYQIKSACRDLSKIFEALNDPKQALYYLNRSYELTDEIFSNQIATEIAKTQSIYELEQKQQRITILEQERSFNHSLTIISYGAVCLFFLLGGFIFYQQKSKNAKQHRLLEAEASLAKTQLENTQLNEQKLKTELENTSLKEQQLLQELDLKSKSLTKSALHMIQKNEFLNDIKSRLKDIRKGEPELQEKRIKKLIKSIDFNFTLDDDWQEFETVFQQVHSDFFEKLKMLYPKLTPAEVRLCAMIRLNLHSKDMAAIMGISQDSLRIARYRLRKKLGLDKGSNLYTYILNIG